MNTAQPLITGQHRSVWKMMLAAPELEDEELFLQQTGP